MPYWCPCFLESTGIGGGTFSLKPFMNYNVFLSCDAKKEFWEICKSFSALEFLYVLMVKFEFHALITSEMLYVDVLYSWDVVIVFIFLCYFYCLFINAIAYLITFRKLERPRKTRNWMSIIFLL